MFHELYTKSRQHGVKNHSALNFSVPEKMRNAQIVYIAKAEKKRVSAHLQKVWFFSNKNYLCRP